MIIFHSRISFQRAQNRNSIRILSKVQVFLVSTADYFDIDISSDKSADSDQCAGRDDESGEIDGTGRSAGEVDESCQSAHEVDENLVNLIVELMVRVHYMVLQIDQIRQLHQQID